ncbi:cytochrome c biogenesis protein ResB [Parachitinimonas caeni]|uniref:Cytochrome c biogenesis protein ResB n=1 Tax=Parachitinimonas caeni TaxID=3031301 RepID=A0ABT7DQY1_9NEIS|nr:cytochrome c biogenesis protein ResB [Parachitinimonas caeni]MDK2122475.1 cytochrome c biogenesis protein ResB [Parachitinimonas caeni]
MRFAISLLVVLAIASIIGTVLKQNEPYSNYVFELGPFWAVFFEILGLYDVYHSTWFLFILGFVVVSTAFCIYRHLPGILRDMRSYRDSASLKSLRAMAHHAEFPVSGAMEPIKARILASLQGSGYQVKVLQREDGLMFAAKRGSKHKLGYLLAHSSIVLCGLGFMLDGNPVLRWQQLFGTKVAETRDLPQSKIPAASRLAPNNLAFRGNVTVPTNAEVDVIFINSGSGYFVQELPFSIKLNKFQVEHYSTGQPKLFASDITVTEKATGKLTKATVSVNHPLVVNGIAIYQASFGDGGSKLELMAWNLFDPAARPHLVNTTSLNSQPYQIGKDKYTLELGEFRPFNIETMDEAKAVNKEGITGILADVRSVKAERRTRNMGPSIQFKLRDTQGQAREFLNYMSPAQLDGRFYLLSGVRTEVAQPFGFVRWPLDESMKIDGFMRLRAVMLDAAAYPEIARRAGVKARAGGAISASSAADFERSVVWVLQRFAEGGFAELDRFLKAKVPEDKRKTVAETYIKILQGAAAEALALADERAELPFRPLDEDRSRFLMDGLVAISASFDYGVPVYLQPVGFEEVKASGLQLTREPGKSLIYLAALMMICGVFCMFYIRESRIWLHLTTERALLAISSNRRNSELDREFEKYRTGLAKVLDAASAQE